MEIEQGIFEVAKSFIIQNDISSIETIKNGLINTTYKITTRGQDNPNYLLQKVNSHVFKDVPALMANIDLITSHIENKEVKRKERVFKESLKLVPHLTGLKTCQVWHQNYWRVFNFIEGGITKVSLESEEEASELGRAFAEFQRLLVDLPADKISESIPDFHNLPKRIKELEASIELDSFDRLKVVEEEVEFLSQKKSLILEMYSDCNAQSIKRLVHQDAKLSNILFDKNGEALCVIDLDTVMPGYLYYDFGDIIRNSMNTQPEDSESYFEIEFRMDYFKVFARSYLKIAKEFISEKETQTLVKGGLIITYEQAIRFLTDYLTGDVYYTCLNENHNLIRARNQVAFLKALLNRCTEMEKVIFYLL